MSRYNRMMERAKNEQVILMDGATGTEVERRGVAQLNNAWNGGAALSDPDILRTVHEDYIRNGAEIIISNTFANAKHALIDAGRETDFEKLNSRAIQIAVEARNKTNADHVCVAGGISYWTWTGKKPSLADLKSTVTTQAQIMAESGADLLMLEMMIDIEQMMATYEAAKSSGLPTWIGLTCEADDKGEIYLRDGEPLAQALASLSNDKPDVINIMHTDVSHVTPALNYLKGSWKTHVGVYAHSGKTINGKWTFNDVLSPAEYQQNAESWIDKGVTFIGGCCGISVKHIALLNKTLIKNTVQKWKPLINCVSIMPHADIKYTFDIQIDLKTLMSDIEEIILDLDPTSGAWKGRALKVDEYHHSHIKIEIRLFATKNRDFDLLYELINRIDSRVKSFLKKAVHVTVKLQFTPLTYVTGFYDPANPD